MRFPDTEPGPVRPLPGRGAPIGPVAPPDQAAGRLRRTKHNVDRARSGRLKRPGKEFLYVVKRGSHIPYEKNYPAGMLAAGAPRPERYAAAVGYTTARFFDRLPGQLPPAAVLIYTSDHGQDLAKTEVHCSAWRIADEFAVPIAVFAGDGGNRWRRLPAPCSIAPRT